MGGGHIAHVAYRGPSVVKEILMGMGVALMAGGVWKMHQWKHQRLARQLYDMLDKDEISIVREEDE